MSTIHNPVNFEPGDYEVIGYFDNQPPKYYFGMSIESFELENKLWREERDRLFGGPRCYRCCHCGQSNVRYVVAVKHKPTGEHVCFGDICVERLDFEGHDQFAAKHIRSAAQNRMLAEKRAAALEAFCNANPDAKWAMEHIDDEIHARNSFAHDLIRKLREYGNLTERQLQYLKPSMLRDIEHGEQRKAEESEPKGDAPEGRQTILVEVLATKWQENDFGGCLKMLCKLDNNAKVWCSVPDSDYETGISFWANPETEIKSGKRIKLTATFSRNGDPSFAYGKRPRATLQF